MSNVLGYLAQIFADVQLLKGLMARIAAASGISGAASGPTCEFVCDMFDRGDQGTLDGYWNNTNNLALRNGTVLPQGSTGVSNTFLTFTGWANTYTYYIESLIQGLATSQAHVASSVYQAVMSSPDMHIKLTFSVPSIGAALPAVYNQDVTSAGGSLLYQGLASVGASFGDGNRTIGYHASCLIPQQSLTTPTLNYLSAYMAGPYSTTMPYHDFVHGAFTDSASFWSLSPFAIVAASPALNPSGFSSISPAPPTLFSSGNTLELVGSGNLITVYLNGTVLYTAVGNYLTRSRVALTQNTFGMVNYFLNNGISFAGVTSFKAWVSSMPEPPNQTGRGNYWGARSPTMTNTIRLPACIIPSREQGI